MPPSAAELVASARAALDAGDVGSALATLEQASRQQQTGDVLAALAEATHRAGGFEAASELFSRACACYEQEGRPLAAARVARTLAYQYVLHGDGVLASGWTGRARRLVGERRDTVEGQWVELFDALGDPDPESRERRLRALVIAARGLGDRNLECDALGLLGRLCVDDGRLSEGMALLDEALTAVHAGEVDDFVVVEGAFCLMLGACETTQDVGRAEQWTRLGERLTRSRGIDSLGPLCRGYYGGVLMAAGRYAEAEDALTGTIEGLEHGYALARESALARLAELRLRQGRPEEAELLLRGLEELPDAAYPWAALHLARGERTLARDRVERSLDRAHGVAAGRLLGLLVDLQLAEGEVEAAGRTVARLEDLASEGASGYLTGVAALAHGRLHLARGSAGCAPCLREALAAFAAARMPLELAETRIELARAVSESTPEVAVAEATLALEACEMLAATGPADRASALLRQLGAPGRTGPRGAASLTRREIEVLDLLGHGLSNPEIAQRLVLSRKTVEHHVSRVLQKLDLRNRAEAAAYAVRERGR